MVQALAGRPRLMSNSFLRGAGLLSGFGAGSETAFSLPFGCVFVAVSLLVGCVFAAGGLSVAGGFVACSGTASGGGSRSGLLADPSLRRVRELPAEPLHGQGSLSEESRPEKTLGEILEEERKVAREDREV